jgi:hypothetical protein
MLACRATALRASLRVVWGHEGGHKGPPEIVACIRRTFKKDSGFVRKLFRNFTKIIVVRSWT